MLPGSDLYRDHCGILMWCGVQLLHSMASLWRATIADGMGNSCPVSINDQALCDNSILIVALFRQSKIIVIPPFALYIALVSCGKASLGEVVAIIPSAVNIGTIMIIEWDRGQHQPNVEPAQYTF